MPLPPVPAIRTPRLVLRELQASDLDDLMVVNGDPEVTRFLPYAPWAGPAGAQAWSDRMDTLIATGTARQLVIVRAADGRVIGTLLLFRYDEGSARLELGYVLGREHWRRGYAREAVHAALQHAFGVLGIRRVEAEVNPANVASNELLRALGFRREGLLRQRWVAQGEAYDVVAWGLLAAEWPIPWRLRRGRPADAAAVAALIASFQPQLTLDATGAGAEAYLASVSEAAERGYLESTRHRYTLAEDDEGLAGFIAMRDGAHLFHLFVAARAQRRGLGRRLWEEALADARLAGHDGGFTVNSSRDAEAVYRRLGFEPAGPPVQQDGIAFRPMRRPA